MDLLKPDMTNDWQLALVRRWVKPSKLDLWMARHGLGAHLPRAVLPWVYGLVLAGLFGGVLCFPVITTWSNKVPVPALVKAKMVLTSAGGSLSLLAFFFLFRMRGWGCSGFATGPVALIVIPWTLLDGFGLDVRLGMFETLTLIPEILGIGACFLLWLVTCSFADRIFLVLAQEESKAQV